MELTYSLGSSDYLTQLLYEASINKGLKRNRLKSWIIVTLVFVCLSFLFYQSNNQFLFKFFSCFTILTLFVYPFYQKNHYKRHYLKFINGHYKNRFGIQTKVVFNGTEIEMYSQVGESKMNYETLEKITEISSHFFLRITTGNTLIIHKNINVDPEKLRTEFQHIAKKTNINYTIDTQWKWKNIPY